MSRDTRQRIVEAALRRLEVDGYVATSVKDIAAEAQVAQGLVHYYFSTKEDLVVAALERACEQLAPVDTDADPATFIREAFAGARSLNGEELACQRLLVEMAGLALHNESIREALVRHLRRQRHGVEAKVEALTAGRREIPAELAQSVGGAIDAALFGIWTFAMIDPEFDAARAIDALGELTTRAAQSMLGQTSEVG
ncbi:MAG TPA: TetR family transcriptional regulator [Candidatus Dormibacteraeota bacterium]|jgi:AcrR family transcriptional regulator|nr:TetR family transcriptional regulator [Candidatus Dormibacteraeota bacterium]